MVGETGDESQMGRYDREAPYLKTSEVVVWRLDRICWKVSRKQGGRLAGN